MPKPTAREKFLEEVRQSSLGILVEFALTGALMLGCFLLAVVLWGIF